MASIVITPWIPSVPGHSRVIYSAKTSSGSTYNYGDFTATNAFFWSSIDLSNYAGTDSGETPYYIVVTDGAGKTATGYIANKDVGVTLGSELLTSWNNHSTDPYDTLETTAGNITSLINLGASTGWAYSNETGFSTDQLIKVVIDVTLVGTAPYRYIGVDRENLPVAFLTDETTYFTGTMDSVGKTSMWVCSAAEDSCSLSCTFSVKRVIHAPATAVHIVSALNSTTRDWANRDSGFFQNDIASWIVYGWK